MTQLLLSTYHWNDLRTRAMVSMEIGFSMQIGRTRGTEEERKPDRGRSEGQGGGGEI
jgi:hypothetical protein